MKNEKLDLKIVRYIPKERYKELLTLIHGSFESHQKKGIYFTCSQYTLKDLEEKVLSETYFIALSKDDQILGITAIKEYDNYAYAIITAISPSCKHMGIGSLLYSLRKKYLLANNKHYVLSDTAVNAVDSVKWHLKKCGCRKVGYASFPSTNYYSYIFREDIISPNFLTLVRLKIHYFASFVKCRLFWHANGKETFLKRTLFRKW